MSNGESMYDRDRRTGDSSSLRPIPLVTEYNANSSNNGNSNPFQESISNQIPHHDPPEEVESEASSTIRHAHERVQQVMELMKKHNGTTCESVDSSPFKSAAIILSLIES